MKHGLRRVYREDVIQAERNFRMKCLRILGLLMALAVYQKAEAQTATVTWTNTHQIIDGFGGGSMGYMGVMNPTLLNFYYGTGAGDLGFTFLRTRVGFVTNGSCYGPDGAENNGTTCVSVDDITNAKNVIGLGGKVWASSEGTPSHFQNSVGAYVDNPTNNSNLAALEENWVSYVNSLGVPIYALSPQQEPDIQHGSATAGGYTSMTPANFTDIAPYLHSDLATGGFSSTKIYAPEVCCVTGNYTGVGSTPSAWFDPIMTGTSAADIGLLGMHGYGGGVNFYPKSAPNVYGLHYWMSEVSDNNATDLTMTSAIQYALSIHDWIGNANASSYQYWLLDCTVNSVLTSVEAGENWCLSYGSGSISKRAYVFGNWSAFARPGWVRIDTTTNPQPGVYVTAFKSPSETSYSIVAVNTNTSATLQTFEFNGFPVTTSVIPWVTSSDLDLVAQAAAAVDGNSLSFSLPAKSVTTFVGTTGGSTTGKSVAPPSGLSVNVK